MPKSDEWFHHDVFGYGYAPAEGNMLIFGRGWLAKLKQKVCYAAMTGGKT